MLKRRLAALVFVAALALAAPASAGAAPKCNAGNGNGSEGLVFHDCDPGNSGANNKAGD